MKLRYYILLGVFSFVFFLIALFPAALAWKMVPGSVTQNLPIRVEQVGGTLWDGFMVGKTFQGPVKGQHVFAWDLNPLWLLLADLNAGLRAEGDDYRVSGTAHFGLLGKGVSDLDGRVQAELVNDMLKQLGAKASGELMLKDVTLEFGSGTEVEKAEGLISWGGGPVSYRQGRHSKNLDVPAIKGTLDQKDGGLLLSVVEAENNAALGELTLKGPIGGVVVYKRVMRIAGMGNPADEDAVLVQLQQPIL
ncbi:MAG: type II secretion system protein N [Ketobacteraceae bacterium]|nr:type II secretion system protein N [Ketobacteraceae bacterium]